MRRGLALAVVSFAAFLNPVVDAYAPRDPVVLTAAHYAFYAAGFFSVGAGRRSPACLAAMFVAPIVWLSPHGFAAAASSQLLRVLDYVSLFVAGMCAGVYVRGVGLGARLVLLVLYMVGDSVLTAEFLLGGVHYSRVVVPYSPFEPGSFGLAGLLMAGVMSLVSVLAVARIVSEAVKGALLHGSE